MLHHIENVKGKRGKNSEDEFYIQFNDQKDKTVNDTGRLTPVMTSVNRHFIGLNHTHHNKTHNKPTLLTVVI